MPQFETVFSLVRDDLNQRRYSSAMSKLTFLSHQHSRDLRYLRLLAETQKCMGDFSNRIKTLNVISQQTKNHSDYIVLMTALYGQGRLNEALDVALLLQDLSLSESEKKTVVHALIKIYLEFNDYEGVDELCSSQQYENDDVVLWARGLVRLAAGDKNEALDSFRKAVTVNPANDQAWISLSLLHDERGDRDLALANLDRAFDVNPHNATGLKLLAKWHRRDPEQSEKVLGKIRHYLAQYEFDEEISLCYMQMLKEKNDFNSLSFEAEKLILNNPTNPEFRNLKNIFAPA